MHTHKEIHIKGTEVMYREYIEEMQMSYKNLNYANFTHNQRHAK